MKRLLALIFAQALAATTAHAARFSEKVGIYHWGGGFTTSMSGGVSRIANLGGHVARVTMAATYYRDYNIGTSCYPQFSLTALAKEPDVKEALDNPNIHVFMLTAYDGITLSCETSRYLDVSFYTAENMAAVSQEYSDFVLYLYQTYAGTGKRFIISNWEGDNAIYCGDAHRYAMDEKFRSFCNSSYPSFYRGNSAPSQSFQAMKYWLWAREKGIADGRNRAGALGLGSIDVYHAPEFCVVHALKENNLNSVLYDVIPSVNFDYVSYSSYETIKGSNPLARLAADLKTIANVIGSKNIILGETGFARSIWGHDSVSRADTIDSGAIAWGVAYIFQWELYDQDATNDFGLYDLSGKMTPLGGF